jgi:hypothetical protein
MSKTLRNRSVRAGNGSKNPRPSRLHLMKHAGYEVVLSTVVMAQSTHENFSRDAPAVLREDVAEWFELESDSPYMLVVADVRKEKRRAMSDAEQLLFGIDKLNVSRWSAIACCARPSRTLP